MTEGGVLMLLWLQTTTWTSSWGSYLRTPTAADGVRQDPASASAPPLLPSDTQVGADRLQRLSYHG